MYRSPSLLPTKIARLWVILNFCFKTTLRANENEFCLHENKHVGGIPRHKLENCLLKRDLPEKALWKWCQEYFKFILVYSIHSWMDFHLQESRIPLAVERSAGLFDSESALFKTYVLLLSTLLLVFLVAGSVWELAKRVKRRQKVETDSKWNHTSSFKALNTRLSLVHVFAKPRDWLENLSIRIRYYFLADQM